jgi:hypothetical protein
MQNKDFEQLTGKKGIFKNAFLFLIITIFVPYWKLAQIVLKDSLLLYVFFVCLNLLWWLFLMTVVLITIRQ